jgi:hypothetical protein
MMVTLMAGVILGLVAWSSRISAHHGIIKTPESHYDYIIGKYHGGVDIISCNIKYQMQFLPQRDTKDFNGCNEETTFKIRVSITVLKISEIDN